jgi:hypothetical protein
MTTAKFPRGDKRRMVQGASYHRNPDGSYSRWSMAFLFYCQWERRNPHLDHGANAGNPRTKVKALPPRKYSVWPTTARLGGAR